MRRLPAIPLVLVLSVWAVAACSSSSSEAPNTTLSLAPTYHLKTIDGVLLPIQQGGGSIDSGHVHRLGGDSVRVDQYINSPNLHVIAFGVWRATQFGNTVVLFPILGTSSLDTAFLGAGDTLTLHDRAGGGATPALHVEIFVAPLEHAYETLHRRSD